MQSDEAKRQALLAEIARQGGPFDAEPLVTLEQFFDGNHDLGSIGCNLWDHPGIETFRQTLVSVRARDDVQDALVSITDSEPETEGIWPFSDTVYVLSSADRSVVAGWLAALQPDEVAPHPPGATPPPGLPAPGPGTQIYVVWWD